MTNSEKRAGRVSKKDLLLEIATGIVSEHGLASLTIDGLALAADVSKAGVVYHFKTRDDLIAALVARIIEEFDVHVRLRQNQTSSASPLKHTLNELSQDAFNMTPSQRQFLTNMLAAASLYPQLIGPVKAMYESVYLNLEQAGESAGRAMVLAAALDGITLLELLNFHHFSAAQREAIRSAIDHAIRELP
ncbi:MAG: TetR/AcrR family transcriptional regulator [Undibacterium curvum]|uniref:TetR/AcrR family transcriptional regulator n=1 Tax=Undibacterium curvum TaxID=2762294 RepID=UPI003BBFA3C7